MDTYDEKDGRHVRDPAFWGAPVGTPLPLAPGADRRVSGPPRRRVRPPKPRVTNTPTSTTPERVHETEAPRPKGRLIVNNEDASPEELMRQFWDGQNWDREGLAREMDRAIPAKGMPDGDGSWEKPIDCGTDVQMAARLILKGRHVRLDDDKSMSVLLEKLAIIGEDAFQKGTKAPNYDLCLVHIPGTNLFCEENKGHHRVEMPQFSGTALPGSFAESLPQPPYNDDPHERDTQPDFLKVLDIMGIPYKEEDGKLASELKSTQRELVGPTVAAMAKKIVAGTFDTGRIVVTRDGYIIDGHHRWAAVEAADLIEDGKFDGGGRINVTVLDLDIGFALDLASAYTSAAGIKKKKFTGTGTDVMAHKTRFPLNPDGTVCWTCAGFDAETAAFANSLDIRFDG